LEVIDKLHFVSLRTGISDEMTVVVGKTQMKDQEVQHRRAFSESANKKVLPEASVFNYGIITTH